MSLTVLSPEQIDSLTPSELEAYEADLEALYWARGKTSFLDYCTMVELPGAPIDDNDTSFFPDKVKPVAHHKLLINAIQGLADGTLAGVDGIMCYMPPGSAKSSYLSVLGASWLIGRKPGTNVIGASYGQDLASRFGRRVRHIARSAEFERIMGSTITGDNQAVDNWSLTNGSDYRAAGFGAAVTGFRADWALIDDPIKNREDADSEVIRNKIYASYEDDISTRLKPGGKIVFALTRWHQDDPAGRILGEKWKGQSGLWRGTDGRLWLIINLPLLAEHADDPLGRAHGALLWPEWFRLEDAKRLQDTAKKGGSAARTWSSLYQQRPAPNEGAILARSYWREWTKKDAPECSAIYLSYDTAFEEDEQNDPSAMTAWGVFEHISRKPGGEEYKHNHIIMLGAWEDRVSAVDLIDTVQGHAKLFQPDRILVEKRASGIQLIQELQRRRLPVKAWLPRGKPGAKGKVPRAHAIATILEGGSVWYIPGPKTEMVIEQCASFPFGVHDDLCLVAGTKIALRRGLIPIEQVCVGDEALTPQGWRRVSATGFTGLRPVVSAFGVTGTGNHPVFTLNSGYRPLESVIGDDDVTVSRIGLWSLIRTIRQKPWCSTASDTTSWERGDITSRNTQPTQSVKKPRGCTLPFGSMPIRQLFHQGTRSITKTAIHSTAVLRIWSAYQRIFIADYLAQKTARLNTWLTLPASGRSLSSGIGAKMAASGTGRMRLEPVSFSQECRGPLLSQSRPFIARFAEHFLKGSTSEKLCVQRPVMASGSASVPVYNLTVEGAHCYYANGVLVHNCDTVTCALAFFRDKYIFQTHEDELDPEELKEELLRRSDNNRRPRSLYSGPVTRASLDLDEGDIERMTPEARRRLYS